MQKILLSLVLFVCVQCGAQEKADTVKPFGLTPYGPSSYMSSELPGVWFYSDGTIKIEVGTDTINIIRTLNDRLKEKNKEYFTAFAILQRINLDVLVKWFKDKTFTRLVKEFKKQKL